MNFNGKVAIVTGGSKGYGYGIAAKLKEAGAEVWITGRNPVALEKAASALGVRSIRADVSCSRDWDLVFETVVTSGSGKLDILVNNAGAGVAVVPVQQQSDEEIIASINTNLTGTILGCRRAAAVMSRQKSGIIINISSVCALYAWPGWSVYTAAKAGLSKFGHGLHAELRPFGVRVTTITPSWGATDFGATAKLPPQTDDTISKCMQPNDMGQLVIDLCAMPAHLVVPDLTVMPMIQEIIPF